MYTCRKRPKKPVFALTLHTGSTLWCETQTLPVCIFYYDAEVLCGYRKQSFLHVYIYCTFSASWGCSHLNCYMYTGRKRPKKPVFALTLHTGSTLWCETQTLPVCIFYYDAEVLCGYRKQSFLHVYIYCTFSASWGCSHLNCYMYTGRKRPKKPVFALTLHTGSTLWCETQTLPVCIFYYDAEVLCGYRKQSFPHLYIYFLQA